ncbi:50S ribosomal protein L16 [Candidatus Woesearchaeota archaeon]|nr:50S ribosomal protein L16 [Candidatus Woesearchaeota archaeon]
MPRIRKGCSYHKLERPYTRISKFRQKSFIRANPALRVVRFNMGNDKKKYKYTLSLRSNRDIQIRDNALESARQTSNRVLEKVLGAAGYFMKVKLYPHHVLRENPLAAGAGADRFSTGMQKAFGKPLGSAARVKKGQVLFELRVNKASLELARKALTRAAKKLPCSCLIEIKENK